MLRLRGILLEFARVLGRMGSRWGRVLLDFGKRRPWRAAGVARALATVFAALVVASLSDSGHKVVQVVPGALPLVPASVMKRPARIDVLTTDDAGVPLAGALVQVFTLLDDRAFLGGVGRADAAGHTKLGALPAAETWVLAEADGYARVSTHVVLEAGAREIKLPLGREHLLRVLVSDDGGAPLREAAIEVDTGDPIPIGGQTDAAGTATIGRLGPPPWTVRVSAVGFEAAKQSIGGSAGAEPVQVTLRRLGALDVAVVDGERRPLVGATVMAVGSGLWPARAAATDGTGHARVPDLPRGFYDLRAIRGDLVSSIEVGVALGRGELKAVTLRVDRGRRVAVRLRDGEGDDAPAVAGANVVLAEGGLSSFPLETRSDDHGDASLGPIAPGTAYLSVQAAGFVAKTGVAVPDGPEPVVSVVLVRGGALSGEVVDTRGFPIAGATIEVVGTSATGEPIAESSQHIAFRAAHFAQSLRRTESPAFPPFPSDPLALREPPPSGELGVTRGPIPAIPRAPAFAPPPGPAIAPAPALAPALAPSPADPLTSDASPDPWVTARNGRFRASPIAPGSVRAIARHPAYVEASSETVTVAPGADAHVRIVLSAGATFEGRLLDDRRMPVPYARLRLVASEGFVERATSTARDGTFAFARVPPSAVLSVSLPDEISDVALRVPVSLEEGQRREMELVLPPVREPVVVRVAAERGDPVEGAEVLLVSLSNEAPIRRTRFTDRGGEATFAHAAGLPIRVSVTHRGHAPVVQEINPAPTEIALTVGVGLAVTGSITTAGGRQPLDGTEVTLYAGTALARARTDRDGTYRFDDVPPGRAQLVASRAGYVRAEQTLSIEAPDRTDRPVALDPLDLEPGGVVVGEVVDSSGNPVAGARVTVGSPASEGPSALDAVAMTNARGQFRLEDVAGGEIAVEASAPNSGRGRAEPIHVTAGETTAGVRIELAR